MPEYTPRVGKLANRAEVLYRSHFRRRRYPGRRNVFDATLDLMAPTFLTSPRNIAPVVSRMRFEAIDNLRVEWDLDYDPIAGSSPPTTSLRGTALDAQRWAWATRC